MNAAEVLDILALAHALIDAGWTQGAAVRRKDGTITGWRDPQATHYCLVGALDVAAAVVARLPEARTAFFHVARGLADSVGLSEFNDARGRRKRDVLRLIEQAAAQVGKS